MPSCNTGWDCGKCGAWRDDVDALILQIIFEYQKLGIILHRHLQGFICPLLPATYIEFLSILNIITEI